ncbi:hypothetical protein [Paenibacillus graminis]|uniref:hypothetical protein n=1 Tax=Paenibacillus graminis TaxID=189425 RepID=UPI002DB986DD|nr:hypothetical protein [Paenibacillus graminis]MEC0167486.1 hypothetical protein [Paenibacillus graminis]
MKKKIIGIAAAALLLGSTIGYAASSSLIGAKVTGLFSVEQNGKKIADAVIINGSAYAPVRAISDATGTELAVEGKKITMKSKSAATAEAGKAVVEPVATPAANVDSASIAGKIKGLEDNIKRYKEVISQAEADINATTDPAVIQGKRDYIADINGRIALKEAQITELKAQLGE